MPAVKMLVTAANPARVLRAGKCFNLTDAEAQMYLECDPPACTLTLDAADMASVQDVPPMPDPDDRGPKQPVPTSKKK